MHLLSTSTRRWNYIWYAIRLVVSISSDVKRYSSLRSGALSCRWITYFWPVSLLRRFERRSVGLSSAISLPLKGARKAIRSAAVPVEIYQYPLKWNTLQHHQQTQKKWTKCYLPQDGEEATVEEGSCWASDIGWSSICIINWRRKMKIPLKMSKI